MGKKGRDVPILLRKLHRDDPNVLTRERGVVGVPAQSNLLFAGVGHFKTPIDTSAVMRNFEAAAGLKHP